MQLEYRILWFDDQQRAIEPFVDRIKGIIARLGFEAKVDLRIVTADVVDPLSNLPSQHDVDLILMDWKLGGGHDGADLARKLRQSFRDTDIVFYSSEAAPTLREQIFKQDIDGVFCCNRQNLGDRTNGIIHGQLRRILDLNHMRGVVMAATSDLDQGMIECLEVVQKIVRPNDSTGFASDIAALISGSLRKKVDEVEAMGKKGKLAKLLREPAFGPALRLQILREEVAKLADRVPEPHLIEHLGTYHQEVITPRNDFAHRKAEVKDGKLILEGRDQPFDQESMKLLRLRLLKHSDKLRGLVSLLGELAVAAGEAKRCRTWLIWRLIDEARDPSDFQRAVVGVDGPFPWDPRFSKG
jgi:CheY-like chemotaxis protein